MSRPTFRQFDTDVANLKAMLRDAWNTTGAGYTEMAETLRPAVTHLLDFLRVEPGMTILDAATGSGIAASEAARRGAVVTGTVATPALPHDTRAELISDLGRVIGRAAIDDDDLIDQPTWNRRQHQPQGVGLVPRDHDNRDTFKRG